jgi:Protein of unknown function (DUF2963)
MSNALLVRKIVERVAKSLRKPNTGDGQFLPDDESWKVKSSNMHGSDADWYIGFDGVDTANENEYDPKTGKLIKNDEIGKDITYLQQWDADNTGYVEEEDVKRDNGVGLARIVMQQITPIK